jgi:hypothetical protein
MFYSERMIKETNVVLQIFRNLIPLCGVIFFNGSIFALFYSYWLETLGITFCNSIMILTAQNSFDKPPHIKKALFYLIFHAGILILYAIYYHFYWLYGCREAKGCRICEVL